MEIARNMIACSPSGASARPRVATRLNSKAFIFILHTPIWSLYLSGFQSRIPSLRPDCLVECVRPPGPNPTANSSRCVPMCTHSPVVDSVLLRGTQAVVTLSPEHFRPSGCRWRWLWLPLSHQICSHCLEFISSNMQTANGKQGNL